MHLWSVANRCWQVLELRSIEEDKNVNFFFLSAYSHTTIFTTTMTTIPLLSPPLLCVIVDLLYPFFPPGREKGYFRDFFSSFFSRVGGLAGLARWLMAASCAFLWAFFFFHALTSFLEGRFTSMG